MTDYYYQFAIKPRIEEYIDKHNIDLTEQAPLEKISAGARVTRNQAKWTVEVLRKEREIKRHRKFELKPGVWEDIRIDQNYCIENNLIRSSNLETPANESINRALITILPHDGGGMMIGSPTAYCATPPNVSNRRLIDDNLKVANILEVTTNENIHPTIVIGTGVNRTKAELKATHWKINTSTKDFDVILDLVDRKNFEYYVNWFANKYDPAKVILLTSGIWKCCKATSRKYNGLDLNFKDPSEELVCKYDNLHILAMTNRFEQGFDVRYLHDGKEVFV